jgi:hypothetical protein
VPVLVPGYAAFLAHRTLVDGIVDPFNCQWSPCTASLVAPHPRDCI